jgi:hypothetical protein
MNSTHPSPIPLDTSAVEIFRNTLSESDRQALDEILTAASQHQVALNNSDHPLPYQVFLLSLLLEHHKEIARLGLLISENSTQLG